MEPQTDRSEFGAVLRREGVLPPVLLDHTTCSLGRLGQTVLRLIERRLEPLGVRSRHVGVLLALREGGAQSQQALGTYLAIDPATMVATINDLQARRFVRRRRDGKDARRHSVAITEQGERFLDRAEDVLDSVDDDALALLAPRLQRALAQAIRELASSPSVAALVEEA